MSVAAVVGNDYVVNSIMVYCGTTTGKSEILVPELKRDGQTVLRPSYKNTMILRAVMCSCGVHSADCFFCDCSRMSTDTTTDSGTYPFES